MILPFVTPYTVAPVQSALNINDVDPRIAEFHPGWARNRAVIKGQRAIKPAGRAYLPFPRISDDVQDAVYTAVVQRTPFVPAASRAFDGLVGLIFRKPSTIVAPGSTLAILDTITADGLALDDLAEDIVSELLITNFVGLLTDYPVSPAGMSQAQAIDLGYRPYIALYPAESVLGIETGAVNNRQKVVRVRLQKNDDTIEELRLDDGIYTVTKWKSNGGQWSIIETVTPTKAGKPLNEIPFSLVTSNRKYLPAKAKMDDICDLNIQHYIASANLAQVEFYAGNPTPYLFGPKTEGMSMSPGNFITGETSGQNVKIGFLEPAGSAITNLREGLKTLTNDLAKVGSRILAAEKDAVEAAETVAIKTASEDAVLATLAGLAVRWINDQLKWVSWWLDLPEGSISYDLNTDYGQSKMDADSQTAALALWQNRVISRKTLTSIYIDGDVLPANYDSDADQEQINLEDVDRPAAQDVIAHEATSVFQPTDK